MIIVFGLLTVAVILLSLFLILLVLVQLPKKDAGTGMAFGGAAADALLGAGSGNTLTNITKWCIVAFFLLVMMLSAVHDHMKSGSGDVSDFARKVQLQQQQSAAMAQPPAVPVAHPAAMSTNTLKLTTPLTTNTPANKN